MTEPSDNETNRDDPGDDEGPDNETQSPRLDQVEGRQGMPGELIEGEENQPGSQEPPPGAEPSETAISDAKGTTDD